ncbi:uncharacterized protein LOC122434556 [Cervus canadensis]|uniref:uncharacterized protein LOC122434556 n=1 Tax=Cervus canadensis TaxID=1574408 RepID=UPI001CA3396C|nr:uncharacterized protein LOC122434556 [Cervus canadensis]
MPDSAWRRALRPLHPGVSSRAGPLQRGETPLDERGRLPKPTEHASDIQGILALTGSSSPQLSGKFHILGTSSSDKGVLCLRVQLESLAGKQHRLFSPGAALHMHGRSQGQGVVIIPDVLFHRQPGPVQKRRSGPRKVMRETPYDSLNPACF